MANASVDGNPVWYPLSSHDDNSSPLGPPTPDQIPSGGNRSNGGNVAGESIINIMSWSNENKSCMRIDEGWQEWICMRVFTTVMSLSNKNKSCMRIDESWQETVCMRVFSTVMSWSNENKSYMRVDKSWQERVFVWIFSHAHQCLINDRYLVRIYCFARSYDNGW